MDWMALPDAWEMWTCIGGAASFLVTHFVLSHPPIRGPLVTRLGLRNFLLVYSLVSFVTFGALLVGWWGAPTVWLWAPIPWARFIPAVVMYPALVFFVLGTTAPNPTSAGQEKQAAKGPVAGARITRHPMLWGFTLWGLAHLPYNGDLANVVLYATMVLLSVGGMLHIDHRRRVSGGEDWAQFEAQTSIIPFAAVLSGRTTLSLGDVGVWRLGLSVVLYALLFALHPLLVGVSPSPL